MSKEISLKVIEVRQETADTISIVFQQPEDKITYKPGQFLTLINTINGKEERRAYSICTSSYTDENLAVTVKRVEGGKVSNYLNDNVKVGQELIVLAPMGTFTLEPNPNNQRHVVLFGGGSGITPMMSILKTVLSQESGSLVSLIYSNRNQQSVIFATQLNELKTKYGERFRIVYHLDDLNKSVKSETKKGFLGFGSKTIETEIPGFLTTEKIKAYFSQLNIEVTDPLEYFVCGPTPMMETVEKTLIALGADMSRFKKEVFVSLTSEDATSKSTKSSGSEVYNVTVKIAGEEHSFDVAESDSILFTALDKGIDMPFSCQSGLCTACMGKCTSGKVEMDHDDGLTASQVEQGYVLTCIGHPKSEGIVIEIE